MRPMLLILPLILLLTCAPLAAQDAAPAPDTAAQDRAWFEALPRQRQDLLKRRLRLLRAMPPERQRQVLDNARQGRPVLTETQRENLEKLSRMPYLQRVRLYTVARELEAVRRHSPQLYRQAMQRPDADRALLNLLTDQRARMSLSPQEREQLRAMKPEQRSQFLRERHEQGMRERMQRLQQLNPRLPDLQQAAAAGDDQARRELRRAMADLGTLDMLIQRLSPERREAVINEVRDLTVERAAERVRRELNAQWKESEPRRNRRE